MSQICQSRVSILPNKKWTVKKLPKTCKFLPKWIWSVTLVQANYICRYILLLLLGCVDAKNLFFHRRLVPIVNFVFNSLQLIYERHSGLVGMTIVRRLQKLGRKSIEIGRYISAWLLSRRIKMVLVNLYKKWLLSNLHQKLASFMFLSGAFFGAFLASFSYVSFIVSRHFKIIVYSFLVKTELVS